MSEISESIEMHAIFHGFVQGVGFRYTTQKYADELGLLGTVQNLPDGTVEVFIQGERSKLDQFVNNLQDRSKAGSVDKVDQNFYSPKKRYKDFQVIL